MGLEGLDGCCMMWWACCYGCSVAGLLPTRNTDSLEMVEEDDSSRLDLSRGGAGGSPPGWVLRISNTYKCAVAGH